MGAIKKAAETKTKTTTSTSVKKKRAAPKVAKKEVEAEPEVTVRKAEFITKMIEKTGMTKADAESALSAVIDTITEEVSSGKKVSMVGFGTFKLTKRAARKGRNPKTGEEIDIAASNSPSFSAGKSFKERCNM